MSSNRILKLIEEPPVEFVFAESWRKHSLGRLSVFRLRVISINLPNNEPFNLPAVLIECQREQIGEHSRLFMEKAVRR
jgi:hypothetical protein